jgi:hypothetical protein
MSLMVLVMVLCCRRTVCRLLSTFSTGRPAAVVAGHQ